MKRDEQIDIIRGISIILIVVGHAGSPITSFVYMFHVAVFFIVSGYCWNENYSNNLKGIKQFFLKKIKGLYIPYFIWMLIFTLLHNILIKIRIYSNEIKFLEGSVGNTFGLVPFYDGNELIKEIIKDFLFLGQEQLGGASWFIRCLFLVSVLWSINDYILKKISFGFLDFYRILNAFILLFLGDFFRKKEMFLYGNISTVFSVYILFAIGVLYRKYNGLGKTSKMFRCILVSLICIIGIYILSINFSIELSMNSYDNLGIYLISSILGWILLENFSLIISKFNFRKFFLYMGENTLWIMFFHFGAFKFVNALQVVVYELPIYRMASFPTYYVENGWWLVYTIIGIVLPLMLGRLFFLLKRLFITNKAKY